MNAVYSKTQPSALERFLSEVKAPGGAIEIGLERSKEGQAMIEQVVARQRLGAVDETLSAKVCWPVRLCACVTRVSLAVQARVPEGIAGTDTAWTAVAHARTWVRWRR